MVYEESKDWRREQRKEVLLQAWEKTIRRTIGSLMADLERTISSGSRILIVGASGTHALCPFPLLSRALGS
jgi:hypothetical protein